MTTTAQLVFVTKTADTSVSNLSFLDGRASGPYRFLMKYFLLSSLFFVISCATRPPLADKKDDFVHVSTVMDQVQFSYMKGCVDAYKDLKLGPSFPSCKEKAIEHRNEIKSIIEQE